MIDQATQQVQDIEDKYTYNAGENKYEDEKGNQLTPQQFTDLKNNVSVKLDQTLASKKMKPLGVRFNVNDAVGSQYRKAPPTAAPTPSAAAPAASTPKPATHSFSPTAWQKANPNGNLNAAIAKAKKLGFKVGQ